MANRNTSAVVPPTGKSAESTVHALNPGSVSMIGARLSVSGIAGPARLRRLGFNPRVAGREVQGLVAVTPADEVRRLSLPAVDFEYHAPADEVPDVQTAHHDPVADVCLHASSSKSAQTQDRADRGEIGRGEGHTADGGRSARRVLH